MNKRTDKNELLEDVLAGEAAGDHRAASLENVLRLARRRRHARTIRRVGSVAAGLLLIAMVGRYYLAPKPTQPQVATAPPTATSFTLVTTQPLSAAERVSSQALLPEQIVTSRETIQIVQTIPGNYREVGDDELLALAAPRIVALVRRGPHEVELVFVTPRTAPEEN